MTREEAIKIIESNCSCSDSKLREACAMFIPELKESEDEKIRKSIIRILQVGGYMPDEEKNKAFAYLERKKPVQDKEEREYVRTIKSLIADFLRGKDEIDREYYQKIYDWLDGRHIEQKLAEWSEEDEKMFNSLCAVLHGGLSSIPTEQFIYWLNSLRPQPKVECGEEDDRILKNIILDLRELRNCETDEKLISDYKDEIHFLESRFKSLRPQQKYEWSEADEKDLIQLIENGVTKAICKKGFKFHFENEYVKELVEYIKAFNPQPHWKPSEEQMDALKYALGEGGTFDKNALKSLFDDLKKI